MYNILLYLNLLSQYHGNALFRKIKVASIIHDVLHEHNYRLPLKDRSTITQIVNEIVVDRLHIDYCNKTIEDARTIQQVLDSVKSIIDINKLCGL